MKPSKPFHKSLNSTKIGLVSLLFAGSFFQVRGQNNISKLQGISANSVHGLRFGTFCQGAAGGSVIIAPDGSCTVTGNVFKLASGNVGAASFEIEANPGTVISILTPPDIILTGSNGGKMKLHLGATLPASPFTIKTPPPGYTLVDLGGTLTVGSPAANPPGAYTGTFLITFMQE